MFPKCRLVHMWHVLQTADRLHLQGVRLLLVCGPSPLSLLHQIYSNREVEEAMTKIRDVLSDDKRDWELRVAAVRTCPDLGPRLSLKYQWRCVRTELFFCSTSWRKCVRCYWPVHQSSTASCSSCVSWRRRSSCLPRTCDLRWWGRPASLWGKAHGSQDKRKGK